MALYPTFNVTTLRSVQVPLNLPPGVVKLQQDRLAT